MTLTLGELINNKLIYFLFILQSSILWDFIEEREHRLEMLRGSIQTLLLELELEDLSNDLYIGDDSVSETSDL